MANNLIDSDISQELEFLEGQDEEYSSTAQVVRKLQECWMNETFAPELLPYQEGIVDCLLDQLNHMEENLRAVSRADFRSVIHRMELDRLQYVLTSYLKVRLEKVEKQAAFLQRQLEDNEHVDYLSLEEKQYVQAYVTSIEDYLRGAALAHMPRNQQALQLSTLGRGPRLDRPVFLRAERNITGLLVEEGTGDGRDSEIVDLDKWSQYLLMYRPVAPYVRNGSVVLI
ncbi:DNA replication complex GINS protein SLD5-like [Ornithodoros turicata]|uniref:DNA replication complex GINS protein SLD5-like n=1 Tax=Ornithodoros turicata TaxID=34597 RepID=UPI003138C82B